MSKRRRYLRWVLVALASAMGLLFAVTLLASLSPVRERALMATLGRISDQLPGHVEVDDVEWPQLGEIRVKNLRWVAEGDTLVDVERLNAVANVSSLWRGDLHFRSLVLYGRSVNIPEIRGRLAPDAPPTEESQPSRFPRAGSVTPLPSFALDELVVNVTRTTVSPERPPWNLSFAGHVDLLSGRSPVLDLYDLRINPSDAPARLTMRTESSGSGTLSVTGELLLPPVGHLAESLSDVSPLEQFGFDLSGTLGPQEARLAVTSKTEIGPLDSVSFDVVLRPDQIGVDNARLRGRGLQVDAVWLTRENAHYLSAEGTVSDTSWLSDWVTTHPDSVLVSLSAQIEGPLDRLRGTVQVEGGLRHHTIDIEQFRVGLEGAFTGSEPLSYEVLARANQLWIANRGRVVRREPWEVESHPWWVSSRAIESTDDVARTICTWDGTQLTGDNVELLGDLGDLVASGTWSSKDGARFEAEVDWPTAPRALLTRLIKERERQDDVVSNWSKTNGASVRATGIVEATGWGVEAKLQLPKPGVFASMLPDSIAWENLAAPRGEVRVVGRGEEARGTLRLHAEGWLDRLQLDARSDTTGMELDSLTVELLGLRASAAGTGPIENWTGTARLDLAHLDELREVAPLPPDLEVVGAADIHISGPLRSPDLAAEASARGEGSAWSVPGALARVEMRSGQLDHVRLWTSEAARAGELTVQTFAVEARPLPASHETNAPGWIASLEATSDSLDVLSVVRGYLDSDSTWTGVVDTLATQWGSRTIHSSRPFLVGWQPERGAWTVQNVDLRGSLGELRAEGGSDGDSLQFHAELRLQNPPRLSQLEIPEWVWPREVDGTVIASDRDSLTAQLTARGFGVGSMQSAELRVDAAGGPAGALAHLTLRDGDREPISARVQVPYTWDLVERSVTTREGSGSAQVTFIDTPVPARFADPVALDRFLSGEDTEFARFNGRVDLDGTFEAIAGVVNAELSFPAQRTLADHRLTVTAQLNEAATGAGQEGLDAQLEWLDTGTSVASIDLSAPSFDVRVTEGAVQWGDSLQAKIRLRDWRLEDLAAALPPGTRIAGRLHGDITASGPQSGMTLGGWLEAQDLVVTTPQGGQGFAGGRLEFGGTTAAPQITGDLAVSRANLVIPAPPRTLHPMDGDALLWRGRPRAVDAVAPNAATAAAEAVDLGIDISIPGACWLRGRGLEVELAGDLALVLHKGRPRVDGTLQAVRGSFQFVGTRFVVERGLVTFFGTEDFDPNLDVQLTHQSGDVRATVHVTGRSTSPTIRLSSEPAMEEADIMSYLLFGRASNDLDREQSGFLQAQATAAIQLFAVPGLERELSSRLGLDVVRLRERDNTPEQLSVVVGKYLSPRALLSYDQALDRGDDFSINLEYWISRNLRLETTTGRQSQSGVQLNWSRDY